MQEKRIASLGLVAMGSEGLSVNRTGMLVSWAVYPASSESEKAASLQEALCAWTPVLLERVGLGCCYLPVRSVYPDCLIYGEFQRLIAFLILCVARCVQRQLWIFSC